MAAAPIFLVFAAALTAASGATCPAVDPIDHTIHLPHETDCNRFYRCDHGIAKPERCPSSLHFNAVLQVCDWPANANCRPGVTVAPTTPSTARPTTTTIETTTGATNPNGCPVRDPWYTVHLPHESNCRQFYKCSNGQAVLFTCPGNLHFNAALQVCDWPANANCQLGSTTTPRTTQTPTTTPPPLTASPNGCPAVDPLDHTVHLPHETDCGLFYACSNGVPVLMNCPAGLHFNSVLNVCDWPWNARCNLSGEITKTE